MENFMSTLKTASQHDCVIDFENAPFVQKCTSCVFGMRHKLRMFRGSGYWWNDVRTL